MSKFGLINLTPPPPKHKGFADFLAESGDEGGPGPLATPEYDYGTPPTSPEMDIVKEPGLGPLSHEEVTSSVPVMISKLPDQLALITRPPLVQPFSRYVNITLDHVDQGTNAVQHYNLLATCVQNPVYKTLHQEALNEMSRLVDVLEQENGRASGLQSRLRGCILKTLKICGSQKKVQFEPIFVNDRGTTVAGHCWMCMLLVPKEGSKKYQQILTHPDGLLINVKDNYNYAIHLYSF
jgi:hypothetical protein